MNELILEGKKDKLNVHCSNGKIEMSGNSILQDAQKFFRPIEEWIADYVKNPANQTEITLKFEYIDSASVQSISILLKYFKDWSEDKSPSVIVNWYFEFDDPELLELGEILQGRLNIPFNFIEYEKLF